MLQWYDDLIEWLGQLSWTQTALLSLALFLVTFVGSIAIVTFVLVRLPATYFQTTHPRMFPWAESHPALRVLALIGKNVLGALLVLVGIILSLPGVPGQGLLTILLGIMLLDFPGKRRLELKLVRRASVLKTINRLRARFGKPALELDDEESDYTEPGAGCE